MNRARALVFSCVALAAACGDSGNGSGECAAGTAAQGNPACQLVAPTSAPATASGAADYSCLTKMPAETLPQKDLYVRGKTQQRLSNGQDEDKGGVAVEVWTDQSSLSEATRVAKTTSDSAGNYEVLIPVSAWAKASGARVAWRIGASDTVPTVEYNDPIPVSEAKPDSKDATKLAVEKLNRITITRSTLQTIVSLLGIGSEYDKTLGIVLGVVRDCKRVEVEHASAGLVDAAGKPTTGPLLYYFRSKFPVARTQQAFTSSDGYFTLINVPVATSTEVRVHGLLGGKETVLSRQVLPTKSDTVVIADFDPLPKPL